MRIDSKQQIPEPGLGKLSAELQEAFATEKSISVVVYLEPRWEEIQSSSNPPSDTTVPGFDTTQLFPTSGEPRGHRQALRQALTDTIFAATGKAPLYLDQLGAFVFAATRPQALQIAAHDGAKSLGLSGVQRL